MRDRSERLAEPPRTGAIVGQLVVLAVGLDRFFAAEYAPDDLYVLARAGKRFPERLAVPPFDDLRSGDAQTEREPAVREVIKCERVHRARRGSARRDLDDAGTKADTRRVRADPGRRRERVGAPCFR